MNIGFVKDCYGCGVCATACPQNIIEIILNESGFYEPSILDILKCTDCELCCDVCSYLHEDLTLHNSAVHSFAAWSKDKNVRRKCSSGGVSFEVGRALINKGYGVCGVRYNAEINRAEHYIASTVEELIPSIGSKYIQSYTVDGFKAIDRKQKYLVTGTPCQIDSFRRYVRKFKKEENFVLMDFFCHGVPSMLMWNKYIKKVERAIGKVTYVWWRNKLTGWHDSYAMVINSETYNEKNNMSNSSDLLTIEKKSKYNSRLSQGDVFYRLFLSDTCLGKACYEKCKFKYDRSAADIRIGDLWGKIYQYNEDGVSAAVAFTQKGWELLHECNLEIVEHSFDVVAEGQMKEMLIRDGLYEKMRTLLQRDDLDINQIYAKLSVALKWRKVKNRLKHPMRTIKNALKKIGR
ncbi:Coenzyme F420 hydrogenase/dehydrogenase, beta subunit C-terminal domain [Parabacteroides sp. APC149_11_2_Y6]